MKCECGAEYGRKDMEYHKRINCQKRESSRSQSCYLPEEFEKDLSSLVNRYVKAGLKKPDLVAKIKGVTANCELS